MKKDCRTCHYGTVDGGAPQCFEGIPDCFSSNGHPQWEPKTNGDVVRTMTDQQLAKLWGVTDWDDKYFPSCATDPDTALYHKCVYENFTCEGCPRTFLNWLKAPHTEPSAKLFGNSEQLERKGDTNERLYDREAHRGCR